MNILIRGVDSYLGYQTRILNKIWEKVQCDKCVIISRCHDGYDKYPKSKYVDISFDKANSWQSEKIKCVGSVPEWVLLDMQKFESRIYETMIREYMLPLFTFEECKIKYFNEIYFWYHIITSNKIDYMIFHNAPHFTHDYIIYCLGTVLKIPTLLFMPSFFPGRLEWGTEYDRLGCSVSERYKVLLEKNEEVVLPPDLQNIYNKYIGGFRRKEFQKVNRDFRQMYEKVKHNIEYVNKENIRVRRKLMRSNIMFARGMHVRRRYIEEYLKDIESTQRCNMFLKRAIIVSKYKNYSRITKKRIEDKYIYFGLQCNPESSLMPKLPAFYNQKHMIAILANATRKCGMKLYIKEHWNQPIREKSLYEFINQFQNVSLFGPNESNIELLQNSFAVSTGTGSCIMEGMFNNIPALAFGDGYWSGAPGVYRISDEKSCINAINDIKENKCDITEKKIRYYLQAIAQETVPMNLYQKMRFGSSFSDEESINNISEFITQWIESKEREK